MSKSFEKKLAASKTARAALAEYVALQQGASIAPVMRKMVDAFMPEDAPEVLNVVRARLMELRKAKGITKALPDVNPSRISELRSILKLRDYACKASFFDTVEPMQLSLDILVTAARFTRRAVDKKAGVAPSRDVLLREINARKKASNNEGREINVVKGNETIMETAKRMAAVMGKADGAAFLSQIMKASQSLAPIVKRFDAAKKAEAEAARKAKKAGK